MAIDGTAAAAKYEASITLLGGAAAYRACGERKKIGAVAECMHGLKKGLTTSDWAAKYRAAF